MFKTSLLNFTIIFIFRYSSLSCGKVLSNIIYLMKYCHPVNSKMLLSISGKCVFPTLTWFRLSWPGLGPNDWWQTELSQPDPPYWTHNSWPNKAAKTRYLLPYIPLDKQRVPPSSHLCKIKLWRTRGIPKRMQDAINLQCVGHLLGVVARSLTHSPELMLLTWAVAAAFHKNRKTPAEGSTSCGSGAGSGSGWVVVTQSQPARWRHYNDNLSKLRLAPPKKARGGFAALLHCVIYTFRVANCNCKLKAKGKNWVWLRDKNRARQKTHQQLRKRKPTDWTDLNGGPGINPWVQAVASYVPLIGIEPVVCRRGKGDVTGPQEGKGGRPEQSRGPRLPQFPFSGCGAQIHFLRAYCVCILLRIGKGRRQGGWACKQQQQQLQL